MIGLEVNMFYIELQKIPSQILNIVLDNQNCELKIQQKDNRIYSSIKVNDIIITNGILCLTNVNLIPYGSNNYLKGILKFIDIFGNDDTEPNDYREFNDRFILTYE